MKVKIGVLFIVWSLVIGYWSIALAIRPLLTEDCWVTAFGKPAIETGVLMLSKRDNTGLNEIITSIKYGLTENIDIGIDLPYASQYSSDGNYDGMATGTFKIKYNILSGSCEGFSVLFGYQVDTANPQNVSDPNTHDLTSMLIYSYEIGTYVYHLNFGYTFDDKSGNLPQEDFIIYNASVVKPIFDLISIMGEVNYTKNLYTDDIFGETAFGLNYIYDNNLIFDVAVGCGLNENSSSSNLAFGATVLFN